MCGIIGCNNNTNHAPKHYTCSFCRKETMSDKQPDPIPNTNRPVWDLVIEDMKNRDNVGRQRYGVPLQAGNGRDALLDTYEELLDACVYIKQAILERNNG